MGATGYVGGDPSKVSTTDPRLSDPRTPTAHAASHATGGSDPLTPAAIGALDRAAGFVVIATADGVTDVSSAIQAKLDAAGATGGGTVIVPPATGAYLIGATLNIPDNVTVWAYGATIQAKAGWAGYMVRAKGQASGARTDRLRIFGGTWDANGANRATTGAWTDPTKWVGHAFDLQKVDNCLLRDVTVKNALKWAVAVADFTNLRSEGIRFDTSSDGIHVLGPGAGWVCRDVTGTTGDDMAGVSTVEWPNYAVSEGNITDVVIENIRPVNAFSAIRVLGGTGTYIDGLTIRHVHGSINPSSATAAPIYINDDQINPGRAGTDARRVLIEDINLRVPAGKPAVLLNATNISSIALHKIRTYGDNRYAVRTGAGTIGRLILDDLAVLELSAAGSTNVAYLDSGTITEVDASRVSYLDSANTTGVVFLVYVGPAANITSLRVRSASLHVGGGAGEIVRLADGATVGFASLTDTRIKGGSTAVYLNGTTITAPAWELANMFCDGSQNMLKTKCATEVHLANIRANVVTSGIGLFGASASCTVRGGGITPSAAQFVNKDGSQALRVRSLGIPAAVDKLTKTAGDMADNTNGALSCGVGPVVCDGTSWKHLFTGLTY